MGTAMVVLMIIESGVLAWLLWTVRRLDDQLALTVGATIQEEVRRQDDRIEKRLQRTRGASEDVDGTGEGVARAPVLAGRPTRR